MHYHVDPVGGIAGDMFAAAMIDLRPEWESPLHEVFAASGLDRHVEVKSQTHRDHILSGRRFEVSERSGQRAPPHLRYGDIRVLLSSAALSEPVLQRSLAIFELLAQAESRVHGVGQDDVRFHELGAWDSIADVVTASWLIEQTGDASWSCGVLPAGRGRVKTAHGLLPVPSPASALLLEGFPLMDDGLDGERITPTGAAILRYLQPTFGPRTDPMRLCGNGIGFGTKTFETISNVLRVLVFEPDAKGVHRGRVAVCHFEVDDQTPEDLGLALERLREAPGVLDVVQSPVYGKKGRMGVQIQVLVRPQALEEVLDRCFIETTTLGVRWQIASRAALHREIETRPVGNTQIRVKQANRPGCVVTTKAEMQDLAETRGGFAVRERVRRAAESLYSEASVRKSSRSGS
jgi:uncharacterized protein (TIGR00299 family) protein